MPMYQYACNRCGSFEDIAAMAAATEPKPCPECHELANRYITTTYLASTARGKIRAVGLNEIAQNEPRHSSQLQGRHPAGCGCCGGSKDLSRQTKKNAAGEKMFPAKRPWMISH